LTTTDMSQAHPEHFTKSIHMDQTNCSGILKEAIFCLCEALVHVRFGARHPGDTPGANRWFLLSTPIQMLPLGGRIIGRSTEDLPLGCLQGG